MKLAISAPHKTHESGLFQSLVETVDGTKLDTAFDGHSAACIVEIPNSQVSEFMTVAQEKQVTVHTGAVEGKSSIPKVGRRNQALSL